MSTQVHSPQVAAPPAPDSPSTAKIAWKLAVGFLGIFVAAAVLGALFRAPLEAFGSMVVGRFGLVGLAGAIYLVDAFPTPLSFVHFMFLALVGGVDVSTVFLVSATTSYLAGLSGYGVGRAVGMPRKLDRWLSERHPRVRQLLEQHGTWGVVAVGGLPFPLAVGSWSAGALNLPLSKVALALLIRFPKTAVYLVMIERGLHLGGG